MPGGGGMRIRVKPIACAICGKAFAGRHHAARCCSEACRLALRRQVWPKRHHRQHTLLERFYALVSPEPNSGCWLWEGAVDRRGYARMKADGPGATSAAHVALTEIYGQPRPASGHYCCHRCDNPSCVNPEHLYWGTPAQNVADMKARGRMKLNPVKGEASPHAKLTEADVLTIRASQDRGSALARRFGVSHSLISHIRTGRNWNWLSC